jgi:hypothetical protein
LKKHSVHSPAENHWLECGVVSDIKPYDRERYIKASTSSDATIHPEKITYLAILLFGKWLCQDWRSSHCYALIFYACAAIVIGSNVNSQQLYVFAMNNKVSSPTSTSNKCSSSPTSLV